MTYLQVQPLKSSFRHQTTLAIKTRRDQQFVLHIYRDNPYNVTIYRFSKLIYAHDWTNFLIKYHKKLKGIIGLKHKIPKHCSIPEKNFKKKNWHKISYSKIKLRKSPLTSEQIYSHEFVQRTLLWNHSSTQGNSSHNQLCWMQHLSESI